MASVSTVLTVTFDGCSSVVAVPGIGMHHQHQGVLCRAELGRLSPHPSAPGPPRRASTALRLDRVLDILSDTSPRLDRLPAGSQGTSHVSRPSTLTNRGWNGDTPTSVPGRQTFEPKAPGGTHDPVASRPILPSMDLNDALGVLFPKNNGVRVGTSSKAGVEQRESRGQDLHLIDLP